MLDIDLGGINAFIAQLRVERATLEVWMRTFFRSWVLHIHEDIVRLTPQWGGNLAANWYIDVGSPSSTAQDLGDPDVRMVGSRPRAAAGKPPYSRGMDPAVLESLARARRFGLPKLTDQVFIHNPVEYAQQVEDDSGERKIRAINRVPRSDTGKVAMVYHAAVKYSQPGSYP